MLHCRLKDGQPNNAKSGLKRHRGYVHPVADNYNLDLSSPVAMMANMTLGHEFEGERGQDEAQVMRLWVVAETDVGADYQTVEMVLSGVSDEEQCGMRG